MYGGTQSGRNDVKHKLVTLTFETGSYIVISQDFTTLSNNVIQNH